eukprot:8644440-Ditylum_brightwellii.AAC.1
MDEYNLHGKVHGNYIYMEIRKGMYGLPQAGKLLTTYSRNVSNHMDIMNLNTHQVYGSIVTAPSHLCWLSMILG